MMDDFVFVAKVIVKIAGADVKFVSDMTCRDVCLTMVVEELQTDLEDTLASAR